jgi:hypothetical protein
MKLFLLLIITLLTVSCSGIAKSIGKKLPKKLEEAQVYQVSDSVWNEIKLQAYSNSSQLNNDNKLFVILSFKFLNDFLNGFLEENGAFRNLYPENNNKNILNLKYPFISSNSDDNILDLKFKFFLKTHLIENSWFDIPYETEGDAEFRFKPEIKNNKLYFNANFISATGSVLNKVGSFIFADAINLLLEDLNGYEIPESWLKADGLSLENNQLKLAYKINNMNANLTYIDQYSLAYKLDSDFLLAFNKSGKIISDQKESGILIGLDVIQNNIDTILAANHGRIVVKEEKDGDLFYFDSVAVSQENEKLILNCQYDGKFSLKPFSFGLDGEMDIWVEPIILDNKLYLKFDKFIFYGPKKETDLLSGLLNIMISEAIQKILYVDLDNYLPKETEVFKINDRFTIKKIKIQLNNGYVKDNHIFLTGQSSANLIID